MEVKEDTLDNAVVLFAGDSGDGMQLTGTQFAEAVGRQGNEIVTLPDFPAEIRAPSGTQAGVSGFQVNFGETNVFTPGDYVDVLIAMNPAALKVHLHSLANDGIVIVDKDAFTEKAIEKAGYKSDPLGDASLRDGVKIIDLPITSQTLEALNDSSVNKMDRSRCKNYFALGVLFWLYDQNPSNTIKQIKSKFKSKPEFVDANISVLREGMVYASNSGLSQSRFKLSDSSIADGTYRNISGNQALALGLVSASTLAGLNLYLGSYPITPATDILQELAKHKNFGVKTFQAEDEIAAICSAIGAAYAGAMAVTTTSGPGMSLKTEALGLATISELPLVVVNVQRGGPSTGLPTKTEQSDLLQAMFGRHGESPMPVLAASTPADCFHQAIEASRIALKYMTPVILLSDGYLGNGSEPFLIPEIDDLPDLLSIKESRQDINAEGFYPYRRDETTLARDWAIPGTLGLHHRIGGLEKDYDTGALSHDPANHQRMTLTRQEKINRIADDIPELDIFGDQDGGEIAIFSWGSTFGAIRGKVEKYRAQGKPISHVHFTHLNPMPRNTADLIKKFNKIVVAEMNMGQLDLLLRARYLADTIPLTKVQGKPFKEDEIATVVDSLL